MLLARSRNTYMKTRFQNLLTRLLKPAFQVYWYLWGVWVFRLLEYTQVNRAYRWLFYRWCGYPSFAWGILYNIVAFPFVSLYFLPLILGVCYATW